MALVRRVSMEASRSSVLVFELTGKPALL